MAAFRFPSIFRLRRLDRLPLQVRNSIRAATGDRLYVILPVAGASAAGFAGRGARMLAEIRVYADLPTVTADVI